MAKIEYLHPASEHFPEFTETIEARVWALGGTEEQPFYIGSGLNFQANGNLWLEVIYTVEGAQIFYTRNFLHHYGSGDADEVEKRLDDLVEKGEGSFGFGDMLPETSVVLTFEKFTYEDENDEERQSTHCELKLSTDTGAVFGGSGPGARSIDIDLPYIDAEVGVRFMRELIREIEAVQQGKHPDPASFRPGSSEWPFIEQLNQQAYNKISEDYQENYFENPRLAEAFEGWLAQLPAGGHVLDAGCGHGNPVISRLLEKGFQVTGSDFSPSMLRRARQQFPQVDFLQTTTTMISDQAAFDGICSFNSMLYLDPIDFFHSIHRLHHALKPDGLLFLYAFDVGPDWRGAPFGHRLDHWMWSWHYGMEEAASMVEEHGYFRVLETQIVQMNEEDAKRIAQELEKQQQEEEEYRKKQESQPSTFMLPFLKMPIQRSPYAYVVIAQRCEK